MKSLYYKKEAYFLDMFGKVKHNQTTLYSDRNNCISEKHIERWLLINDLLNVSAFLNEGWTPDWENANEAKYIISLEKNMLLSKKVNTPCSFTYFKNPSLTTTAIEVLGEKQIKAMLLG
ncbi:MAG: hypothetical protein PHC83_05710 [Bacteroidales bacterium]|nr:hypothetical protein [Bacteroidales bacterium]MDD4208842.1 hypothetical protein [Bacteroidales bacterium]